MSKKATKKELSPIDIYKLLPKINCKECGQENCMAFATKLVNREATLDSCKPLLKKENEKAYLQLKDLLKPAVKEVIVGVGDKAKKLGGKLVMYRHEFTYTNPTAIAIDVTDEMPEQELVSRIQKTERFSFEYIGYTLKLDMIAIRCTSGDAEKFKAAVKKVTETTQLPCMLCSMNSTILEAGLMAAPKARPLLYAANSENWKDMAELAMMYDAPLVVSAPNDLKMLVSLVKTLENYGVKDLVLDPGTFLNEGLATTLNNFTMLRRAACKGGEDLAGFPLLGVPMAAWVGKGEAADEIIKWKEAYLASMLVVRYADIIVMHGNDGWSLLPTAVLRQNIYTDPRKPVAVAPASKSWNPRRKQPIPCYHQHRIDLLHRQPTTSTATISTPTSSVVETVGSAIDSGVAGRKTHRRTRCRRNQSQRRRRQSEAPQNHHPRKASRISGENRRTQRLESPSRPKRQQ